MTSRGLNEASPKSEALEKVRSTMEQLVASNGAGYRVAGPEVGELVEVATRFTGTWSRGFVVVDVDQHAAYRLRRLSDGHILPTPFSAHEVRADRRRGEAPCAGAA